MHRYPTAHALICAFVLTLASTARADTNGIALCTASGDQTSPVIVSDNAGGAIVTWHDLRPTAPAGGVCYAQRLNAAGVAQWAANGVPLFTTGASSPPVIVADGAGGAIVAFGGNGAPMRAQRVSAAGVRQWGADGAQLSSSTTTRDLAIAADNSAGAAIIAWREDNGVGGTADVIAQKVNAAGMTQWGAAGAPVGATSMNGERLPALISDGAGGAIFIFSASGARAQRLNAAGVAQWSSVPLSPVSNSDFPVIASDGAGGAVVAWAGNGAYAQRVSAIGDKLWNPPNTGVQLATNGTFPALIGNGAGGVTVTWQDFRSGTNFNLYAQTLNAAGSPQWFTPNGTPVCTATDDQRNPTIVSDGGTGSIITWSDERSPMTIADIFAQHVDATGASVWTPDGIPLCTATGAQEFPTIATDGVGGAFVAWQDLRIGSNSDIYIQRVYASGATLSVPPVASISPTARAWPNPFSSGVQLGFELSAEATVRMEVIDVSGRVVGGPGATHLTGGAHVLAWDGRTDSGRPAAEGIYFLRVSGPGVAISRAVVRLE